MQDAVDIRFRKISTTLAEIRAGLGQGLEKLCASWLQHHLKSLNFAGAKIETTFIFRREYEVDVICFNPFLVIE